MKEKVEKAVNLIAYLLELCVSIVILVATVVAGIALVQEITGMFHKPIADVKFDTFLGYAFGIVIGIEFLKMLIKRTPGAVIEVLLYAIARQLIVYHTSTLETLIGIVAVGGIFAIKKFLYVPFFEKAKEKKKEIN